jgi:hypothetical protein
LYGEGVSSGKEKQENEDLGDGKELRETEEVMPKVMLL